MPTSTSRPTHRAGRASVTVREWVWSPAARLDPARAGGPVGEVLTGTGIRRADWALWEQANEDSHPEEFLSSLLMEFMEAMNGRFPGMPVDRAFAWMVTLGGFHDKDSLREVAAWESAGPRGWMYRAVGMNRKEVAAGMSAGTLPDDDTLRVMAALRGTPLPLG